MTTFALNSESTTKALTEEDYIAIEVCDEETWVLYYPEDRQALAERMKRKDQADDAALVVAESDPCARFSKRECDRAGGCCRWVTSGSFNFCKCM